MEASLFKVKVGTGMVNTDLLIRQYFSMRCIRSGNGKGTANVFKREEQPHIHADSVGKRIVWRQSKQRRKGEGLKSK